MTRELVGPGEEQMHLVAHAAGERHPSGVLVRLELVEHDTRLRRRQHGEREVEAVAAVLRHRLGAETFAHASL